MKNKELANLSKKELESKILDSKKELFELRFEKVTKQLKNTMKIRKIKYLIAYAKTILKQKENKKNKTN